MYWLYTYYNTKHSHLVMPNRLTGCNAFNETISTRAVSAKMQAFGIKN